MKKNIVLKLMFLLITLLLLQVVKVLLSRVHWDYGFFAGTIIVAIQFLLLIIFPLHFGCRFFITKISKIKPGVLSWLMVFALLAMAEILFSWWLKNPSHIPGPLKQSYRYFYFHHSYRIAQFDAALCTWDSQLFYTLQPGVRGNFSNAEFSHPVMANSSGMRDDDSSLVQPRVICLGDSYTWGWGVDQSKTWPQLLESQKGMKVLNASMPSYATARSITRLRQLDLGKLEYLLVQYCGNDADENNEYIKNNYHLNISSRADYEKLTRSHRINMRYFPGKNFLLVSSIFLKKLVNKLVPVFSFEEVYGDSDPVDANAIKAFMEVLSKAPVDFTKVKVIVFQLDPFPLVTGRFARLADSLRVTAPYDTVFSNNLRVVDMSKVLTPQDYYILDPHLLPAAQIKVVQAVDSLVGH